MAMASSSKTRPGTATPGPEKGVVPASAKPPKPMTVPAILALHAQGRKIVTATAYDYPGARIVDAAGVDILLVGDSLAMVVLGYPDTLSVTVDEILHHVKAVRRGTSRALLVADMPYGSFHLGSERSVENALRFVKEGGAQAVKIEGPRAEVAAAMVAAEIPVMAHLGLTPQSIHRFGGFKVQGREDRAAQALVDAALELQEAGAFSLVLECIPADLGTEISERLDIPTIGIGAGPGCDGQVLVYNDLLGLQDSLAPRFVRRYADQGKEAIAAIERFADDVREGRYPSLEESYDAPSVTDQADQPGRLY
jgi:3-methyl-2-oxobutanoate hydroxymethyltransferase